MTPALDPTGGPAFPDGGGGQGMTLADWYAGQALAMLGPVLAAEYAADAVANRHRMSPLAVLPVSRIVDAARSIGRAMVAAKAAGK